MDQGNGVPVTCIAGDCRDIVHAGSQPQGNRRIDRHRRAHRVAIPGTDAYWLAPAHRPGAPDTHVYWRRRVEHVPGRRCEESIRRRVQERL